MFPVKALGLVTFQRHKHTVSTDMVSINDKVVACQKVAVLLLDINLPDRNGYDLCWLIKPYFGINQKNFTKGLDCVPCLYLTFQEK